MNKIVEEILNNWYSTYRNIDREKRFLTDEQVAAIKTSSYKLEKDKKGIGRKVDYYLPENKKITISGLIDGSHILEDVGGVQYKVKRINLPQNRQREHDEAWLASTYGENSDIDKKSWALLKEDEQTK